MKIFMVLMLLSFNVFAGTDNFTVGIPVTFESGGVLNPNTELTTLTIYCGLATGVDKTNAKYTFALGKDINGNIINTHSVDLGEPLYTQIFCVATATDVDNVSSAYTAELAYFSDPDKPSPPGSLSVTTTTTTTTTIISP